MGLCCGWVWLGCDGFLWIMGLCSGSWIVGWFLCGWAAVGFVIWYQWVLISVGFDCFRWFFFFFLGCGWLQFVVIVVVWGVIVAKVWLLWLKGCWLWPDEAIFFLLKTRCGYCILLWDILFYSIVYIILMCLCLNRTFNVERIVKWVVKIYKGCVWIELIVAEN